MNWKRLAGSSTVKVAAFSILTGLLILAIFGFVRSMTLSSGGEERVSTLLDYSHQGETNYLLNVKPNALTDPVLVQPDSSLQLGPESSYFRNVIDRVEMTFAYELASQTPAEQVTTDLEVTGTIADPENWSKDFFLLPSSRQEGPAFTSRFRMDMGRLEALIQSIEQVTATTAEQYDLSVTASVHTASTADESLDETFSQTLRGELSDSTFQWQPDVEEAVSGPTAGAGQHSGQLYYVVHLTPNPIFASAYLGQSSSSMVPVEPESPYFLELTDTIDGSFSYAFEADQELDEVSAEVEVTAVVEAPDNWSREFVLVPMTSQEGEFEVNFTLALDQISGFVARVDDETGATTSEYNLSINASVHTVAKSGEAEVDEVFVQTTTATFQGNTFTWEGPLSATEPGSIVAQEVLPGREVAGLSVTTARWLSGFGAIVLLALLGYLGFRLRKARIGEPAPGATAEWEPALIKKKYGDGIVDVRELPTSSLDHNFVLLSSLPDLLSTSEQLQKPILHHCEGDRHTFWVIDQETKYVYDLEPPKGHGSQASPTPSSS